MANEIYYSDLTGDLRLSAMITAEINLLLRDIANLRNSQYMTYVGSINGLGSDTIRVRKADLDGRNLMTALAENAQVTNTALADSHVDIVVGRLSMMYQLTDLVTMTGYGGNDIDPTRLAVSMSKSYEATFADKTADTASSGFGTTTGSNTQDFSVDAFFNGLFELEKADSQRGAVGPFAAVLKPKALTELQTSLRDETSNAISMMAATSEMLKIKGGDSGFVGSLFGCEIYKSSYVNTNASSGYDNFMFSVGAFGYADGVPAPLMGAGMSQQIDKVLIEMDRDSTFALSKIVAHAYLGMAVLDTNKGVLIHSQVA